MCWPNSWAIKGPSARDQSKGQLNVCVWVCVGCLILKLCWITHGPQEGAMCLECGGECKRTAERNRQLWTHTHTHTHTSVQRGLSNLGTCGTILSHYMCTLTTETQMYLVKGTICNFFGQYIINTSSKTCFVLPWFRMVSL